MAGKQKTLYLFLALACFVGIILIFIFDGYVGVYDSLVIDNNQYKQTVSWDEWERQEKYGGIPGTNLNPGGQAEFIYTIENHRFSEYNGEVEATLWYNKVKVEDLVSNHLSIPVFSKADITWTINATDILPNNYAINQNYVYTIIIKNADIEREVSINIYISDIIKVIPAPQ